MNRGGMLLKCARCNRSMDSAAAWVGGLPIGPKCWEKMGDKPVKLPHLNLFKSVRNEQKGLFDELLTDRDGGDSMG